MDADGWRHILTSNSFGTAVVDLRRAVAAIAKSLCTAEFHKDLQAYTASQLIPLDKNPGLRPIGVGEVLRRIIGKLVMNVVKPDIVSATASLQVCADQEAGIEAAVHSMRQIYEDNETEAVVLVDASNAFNSVNRMETLHNISIICPYIHIYVKNCYMAPARLFIIGGKEIHSQEGITQGDPMAMAIYALGLSPLISMLTAHSGDHSNSIPKVVAYADDLTAAGKFPDLRTWWDILSIEGPKYGYYHHPENSWLIVNSRDEMIARYSFAGSNVMITITGQRHLVAVIGDITHKRQYVQSLVCEWISQLELLSDIAKMEPQAAYTAYTYGFKCKFMYFIRTIPDLKELLQPVEDVVRTLLIPKVVVDTCAPMI
ncbi:Uncharacterised protein r2_g3392 [Pycnogonum litorale]